VTGGRQGRGNSRGEGGGRQGRGHSRGRGGGGQRRGPGQVTDDTHCLLHLMQTPAAAGQYMAKVQVDMVALSLPV
jgi:hypothetical protein